MSRHYKAYAIFLPALALMTVVSLGCEPEQMGGPGGDEGEQGTATSAEEAEMFTATVSSDEIELAQGEQAELTLSIDRGDEFDQNVAIETNAPEGIMVSTDQSTLSDEEEESMDDEATLMVEAAADAETKEYSLEIVFTPDTGESITEVVQVTVTAAEPNDEDTAMEED